MSKKVRVIRDTIGKEGNNNESMMELSKDEIIIVLSEIYTPYHKGYGRKLTTGEEGYFAMENCQPIIDSELEEVHMNEGQVHINEGQDAQSLRGPEGQVGPSYANAVFLPDVQHLPNVPPLPYAPVFIDVKPSAPSVVDTQLTSPLVQKDPVRRTLLYYVRRCVWTLLILAEIMLTFTGLLWNHLGSVKSKTYGTHVTCGYTTTTIQAKDGNFELPLFRNRVMLYTDNSTALCSRSTNFCWDMSSSELHTLDMSGKILLVLLVGSFLPLIIASMCRNKPDYRRHICCANCCSGLGWTMKVVGVIVWVSGGLSSCYMVGYGSDDEVISYIGGHSFKTGKSLIFVLPSIFPVVILIWGFTLWRRANPKLCSCCTPRCNKFCDDWQDGY